jgi:hypothetical protein
MGVGLRVFGVRVSASIAIRLKAAGLETLGIPEIAPHPAARAFRRAQEETRDASRPGVA